MKEFSPAGMATKAWYGGPGWPNGGAVAPDREGWQAPKTFGNPLGATSGDGGPGGGPAFSFTGQGALIGADGQQITYGNGVHVAVGGGSLWRSNDDGRTWTHVDVNVRGYGQVTYAGGNVWGVVVASPPSVVRSTDNGLTWGAPISLGTIVSPGGLANNGAGVWIAGGGSGSGVSANNTVRSTDNGLTWSHPGTVTGTLFRTIWDGTQFVASNRTVASGGNSQGVGTSADGITWTEATISAVNNYIFGLNFDPVSGLYIVVTNDQDTIRIANTALGLAAAADTPTGMTDGGSNYCQIGNGFIFAFGMAGSVSRGATGGGPFGLGALGFAPVGDSALACSFDSVTNGFVAVGNDGNVSTFGGGGTTNHWTNCASLQITSTGLYGGGDDGYWAPGFGPLTFATCPDGNSTFGPGGAGMIAGAPVAALAFTSTDWLGNPAVILAVRGTVPQNAFNFVTFKTNADASPETYTSASAQAFSHANPVGYTVWSFAPHNTFQFAGGPDPLTVFLV